MSERKTHHKRAPSCARPAGGDTPGAREGTRSTPDARSPAAGGSFVQAHSTWQMGGDRAGGAAQPSPSPHSAGRTQRPRPPWPDRRHVRAHPGHAGPGPGEGRRAAEAGQQVAAGVRRAVLPPQMPPPTPHPQPVPPPHSPRSCPPATGWRPCPPAASCGSALAWPLTETGLPPRARVCCAGPRGESCGWRAGPSGEEG